MISESELQGEWEKVFLLLFLEGGADFLLIFWVLLVGWLVGSAVKNVIGRSEKI